MPSTTTAAAAASTKVAEQSGIIGGMNPVMYKSTDPINLFVVQAVIIIVFCRILHWPLSKIRQPRVIAEVIGGILLGPTVMGRIPGFTKNIFPTEGMPLLNLFANVGLVLFLFLVGLEVDFRLMAQNWQVALSVGFAGMALPFGLGCALALGLYHEFGSDAGVNKNVNFGVFLLFVGVAFSITAFPVLCRILTELKLLGTNVGTIVLSAGVGNDVVGWILLALTVALVNAGSGITALYVLLVAVGYILFLVFAVRPVFIYVLRRSGSLGSGGPTQGMITLTLLMVLSSAWFANVIGIHAIFGGFVVGLICPHDGGFAVHMTEKIEDLVTVLLLPLYFALSGLKTNIGLLDSGIVWAYVIGVLAIAFIGKIVGGTLAARFCGMLWRESVTIGALMSCKGLVELIVLNIGLTAGIISQRTFTIFVVMALITTFATTPLVSVLYPAWYQKKTADWRAGKINWDGSPTTEESDSEVKVKSSVSRVTALLRLDCLPSLIALVTLLRGEKEVLPPVQHRAKRTGTEPSQEIKNVPVPNTQKLEVHGLRLVEIGERNSAVMRVAEEQEFSDRDPVVNTFKAFARLNNVACAAGLTIIPEDSFSEVLTGKAKDTSSDLLIVPWSETGDMGDNYDHLAQGKEYRFSSGAHTHFVGKVLQEATCSTGVFINRGFGGLNQEERRTLTRRGSNISGAISRVKTGIEDKPTLPILDPSHHIFFPYIGGLDDRAALRFVLQLVKNTNVTATIVHIVEKSSSTMDPVEPKTNAAVTTSLDANPYGKLRDGSLSGSVVEEDAAFYLQIAESLPDELSTRVVFETLETDQAISTIVNRAKQEVGLSLKNAGDLVVIGRGHVDNEELYKSQITSLAETNAPHISVETRRVIGVVAESVLVSQVRASVLVFKAG